jgi:outer membrane protein TolC
VLDVLTAQAALASARAQVIQARFNWYTALAQLAHDTGILGLDGSSPLRIQADTIEAPQ